MEIEKVVHRKDKKTLSMEMTGEEMSWAHSLRLAPTQTCEQRKCCFESLGFEVVSNAIC